MTKLELINKLMGSDQLGAVTTLSNFPNPNFFDSFKLTIVIEY